MGNSNPPSSVNVSPETTGKEISAHTSQEVHCFLGWARPVLQTTVEQLSARFTREAIWDMRDLMLVLPSGLAIRRLQELLALEAESRGKIFYPPKIVTVGTLPEQLYVAQKPFASELVQNLAWVHALRSTPREDLLTLVPAPPPKQAAAQWLELGKILTKLHRELASDRLDFAKVAESLGSKHPEHPRWATLTKIQTAYFSELDRLELWDIQTARLCAIDFNECKTERDVIVVGCVDLNKTQRGFLDAIRNQPDRSLEIWTAAPQAKAELFDDFGALRTEAWQNELLEIPSESLLVGGGPSDQAELAAACLAEFGERFHTRDVTLGVPDAALIPDLKHHLDLCGRTARYGPGSPLTASEPFQLLLAIGRYIQDRSYASFAALVRHPAIERLLNKSKDRLPRDWINQLDRYHKAALPKSVDGFVRSDLKESAVYLSLSKSINNWLKNFKPQPQRISTWVQPLLSALQSAYDGVECDLEDPVEGPLHAAALQTRDAIATLADIPSELEPEMTVTELIEWVVRSSSGALIPEPHHSGSIEMLGWLELALDDTPALVITGMHDGVVPESANADTFLPNQLRRDLDMMDNARRYARDLYSMQVILGTREELRIVVGKSDESGDPLVPSRLLMACKLGDLPARVLHLVQEDQADRLPEVKMRWQRRTGKSNLVIPRPGDVPPPRHITVTAFRDYIQCPYRFYLKHVLRLREQDDASEELDAAMFGNLIHDTLEQLGKSPISGSQNAEEVEGFLISILHDIAKTSFGPNPPAAVLIQIEQAEMRLSEFAKLQASRAEDGWEIRHTETGCSFDDNVLIGRDKKLRLIGRIDRIDYHPELKQWAIWDYKTSETAKKPVSVHFSKKKGWLDLQLPLYRHVAKGLGIEGKPTVGYISIPKQATGMGFFPAEFTEDQLAEADELANEIVSKVAEGMFWPEAIESVEYDDMERICQTTVQHVEVPPPTRSLHRFIDNAPPVVAPEVVDEAERLLVASERSYPHLKPQLIRASAGTGKTFQLSNRLLQIILSGQDIDSILATTFTRKAAGEIMSRVLQRLAIGCLNEKARKELSQHLTGVDTSAANCLAALRRVTLSIHRLRISTLDSFFAQVARAFSLEMGLPPGWSAMDPVQEADFQMQAISQMLDSHDRRTLVELVRMLSKGETSRLVAEQIRRTVSAGFEAYRQTTADAWDKLSVPKPPSEEALESALLTLDGAKIGHKSADSQMVTLHLAARTGDWEAVVNHGVYANFENTEPTYYKKVIPDNLFVALGFIRERAVTEALAVRREQTLASFKVLAAYDSEYTNLIRKMRTLAFSDVTYYLSRWMVGLLETKHAKSSTKSAGQSPQTLLNAANSALRLGTVATPAISFRLDCGVQHLLLDEFQDTAPPQWQILRPLAKPLGLPSDPDGIVEEASCDKSFFCVGDTKQAIYGWRGGVAEIFDSVQQAIEGIESSVLSQSFRSSPEVMEAVNVVFKNLDDHDNFGDCESVAQQWSKGFPEHKTARNELPGYVRLQNGPDIKGDYTAEEKKLLALEFAADQVAELTRKSKATVGILFRSNDDVGRMIGLLRDREVEASQDGGNPLTDSVAVQLLLSLIRLADHPGDSICAFHVATSPLREHLPFAANEAPEKLASWFRRLVSRIGLGEAIKQVADPLANHLSWWDQHRMRQLIRLANRFAGAGGGRLREFEAAVERERVALPTESQVKVMTLHKSKGLEFDAVFLPELAIDLAGQESDLVLRGDDPCEPATGVLRYMGSALQANLPKPWQNAFANQKRRRVIESLCILYVGMTRARHALFMISKPSKSANQQFGSILQSTLGGGEQRDAPGEVLYELGDPEWYLRLAAASVRSTESDDLKSEDAESVGDLQQKNLQENNELLELRLRSDEASAPIRGLRITAPANIGRVVEPRAMGNLFSLKESVGASYGTLIHAFFEKVQWLEEFRFDKMLLAQSSTSALTPDELMHLSVDQTIDDFDQMLKLKSIRQCLSKERYLGLEGQANFRIEFDDMTVDNERAISLVMGDRLVTGTIDRLVILTQDGKPVGAEIIDFKTDSYNEKMALLWIEERIAFHRPQLQVYAEVVSRMFKLPREAIKTTLVMLSTDELVSVD